MKTFKQFKTESLFESLTEDEKGMLSPYWERIKKAQPDRSTSREYIQTWEWVRDVFDLIIFLQLNIYQVLHRCR